LKVSQVNFYNGQYDRSLQGKEGSDFVKTAMYRCRNVLSSNNGELRKRLGTRFIRKLDADAVVIPYRNVANNDEVLVVSNGKLTPYLYSDTLSPLYSTDPLEFPRNDWVSNTNDNFTIASSSIVGNGLYKMFNTYLQLNSQTGNTETTVPFSITLSNTTEFLFNKIRFKWWMNAETPWSFVQYNGYKGVYLHYSDDGESWTPVSITETINLSGSTSGSGMSYVCTSEVSVLLEQINYSTPHKYWRFTFTERQTPEFVDISPSFLKDFRLYTSDVSVSQTDDTPLQYSVTYQQEDIKNIKYSQYNNSLIITNNGYIPKEYKKVSGSYTFTDFIPSAPANMWLNYGYPSCVTHYQNRLWFGGFAIYPTMLKASKFGAYGDFSYSSPLVATDGLELTGNQIKGLIENISAGFNVLYAFSADGISQAAGGNGNIIATDNPSFTLKNREPAAGTTPWVKDDMMFYVSANREKIFVVDYDLQVSRFKAVNLTSNVTDITKNLITEFQYSNRQARLLYGLTQDGQMVCHLFDTNAGINGFFPLETAGIVSDLSVIKDGIQDRVLMVVNRGGQFFLEEQLDQDYFLDITDEMTDDEKLWATIDNLQNAIALDCYKVYKNETSQMCQIDTDSNILIIKDTNVYDFVPLIGQDIKFVSENSKDFVIATIGSQIDSTHYNITITKRRGTLLEFSAFRQLFNVIEDDSLLIGFEYGIIGSSSYLGEVLPTQSLLGQLQLVLPEYTYESTYGLTYTAEAKIRIQNPLESMKKVQQINLATINTSHLEVGTHPDYMLEVEKQEQESSLDALPYTINKTFRMVVEDTPEWTKDIIIKSSKGLPFTITRLEVMMEGGQLKGN